MPKGETLGEFEYLVLLAVLRLGDDAYGMQVRRELAERTGRDLAIGAVYATLDRLESKGFVTAAMGQPSAERGGRAKRMFRVTTAGLTSLNRTQAAMASMAEGLSFPIRGRAR